MANDSKRVLLIVNPISGGKSKTQLVPKLERRLAEMGFSVTTHLTTGPGDATCMASQAADMGYSVVAVCGGDGTVNEAACALSDTGMPMAILPAGSGNGLARHLGLVPDAISAIAAIDEANIVDCDYGLANGMKFFCTFGVGFDAAVAHTFARCHHRGLANYLRSAVSEFVNYRPRTFSISIDGADPIERKAYMVTCCNASQYGNNAFVAPNASITDGYFDVVVLDDASRLRTLLAGADMLTGRLPSNHQVETFRGRDIRIVCHEPTPAHIDGEPVETSSDIHISMVPGSLRVYGQLTGKPFTPFITPLGCMGRDISARLSRLLH